MAIVAALAGVASACSLTEAKAPIEYRAAARPSVPPASRVPCVPGDVPDRDLDQREVTKAWGADRTEIISCDARRAAAVAAIDNMPAQETKQ
ncbi:hypothetical protein QE435_002231 [Rhizobium sp. SORGH_AS 787]|nr:hypothetical protein [Rhizobium sp. SORGH_AS_0787]